MTKEKTKQKIEIIEKQSQQKIGYCYVCGEYFDIESLRFYDHIEHEGVCKECNGELNLYSTDPRLL